MKEKRIIKKDDILEGNEDQRSGYERLNSILRAGQSFQ